MSGRIYPVASCFSAVGRNSCTCGSLWTANSQPSPSSLLRSLSSFVPSSTRSSLMSSLTRWWSRWFQRLSTVRPKSTAQRRPSHVSWCSKKCTTRSACARGWRSRWFHRNLQLLSCSSNPNQEFAPDPCRLRPVWSHSLFSHCCFGHCEHPHPLTLLINLYEPSERQWAHRCWCFSVTPGGNSQASGKMGNAQ